MKNRGPFYCDCNDHAWGILTRGYITLVSPVDVFCLEYHWYAFINQSGNIYAARKPKKECTVYLHREIINPQDGLEVDHVNRNGLDNRRDNIRPASKAQNAANRKKGKGSSSFKGVYFAKRPRRLKRPWVAIFGRKPLGYFASEQAAAAAYFKEATKKFGEFARAG